MASKVNTKNEEHKRSIIGARRRNNIYGEQSDYILIPFLSMGGDGAIYNVAESADSPITIFARSINNQFVIKVLYQNSSNENVVLDAETKTKLVQIAKTLGAVPLYAIARVYSKHTKFFNAETGAKVTSLL